MKGKQTPAKNEGRRDMLNSADDFLTVDEACELMKIGHNAIYKLLRSGELQGIRNGRVWRVPKYSIVDFVKRRTNYSS